MTFMHVTDNMYKFFFTNVSPIGNTRDVGIFYSSIIWGEVKTDLFSFFQNPNGFREGLFKVWCRTWNSNFFYRFYFFVADLFLSNENKNQ